MIGNECDPDNLPDDLPEGMVCQLTSETAWRFVPGRVANAKKGDIVLSHAAWHEPPRGLGRQLADHSFGQVVREVVRIAFVADHRHLLVERYQRRREQVVDRPCNLGVSGKDRGTREPPSRAYPWTRLRNLAQAFRRGTPAGRHRRLIAEVAEQVVGDRGLRPPGELERAEDVDQRLLEDRAAPFERQPHLDVRAAQAGVRVARPSPCRCTATPNTGFLNSDEENARTRVTAERAGTRMSNASPGMCSGATCWDTPRARPANASGVSLGRGAGEA